MLDRHGCRVEAFELSPDYFEGLRQLAQSGHASQSTKYGLVPSDHAVDVWRRGHGFIDLRLA